MTGTEEDRPRPDAADTDPDPDVIVIGIAALGVAAWMGAFIWIGDLIRFLADLFVGGSIGLVGVKALMLAGLLTAAFAAAIKGYRLWSGWALRAAITVILFVFLSVGESVIRADELQSRGSTEHPLERHYL